MSWRERDQMLPSSRPARTKRVRAMVPTSLVGVVLLGLIAGPAGASEVAKPSLPDLGPNVTIFDPSMPVATINAKLRELATASNGYDLNRNAVYFLPGTYGSPAGRNDPSTPSDFIDAPVGFMETISGLGDSPDDVVINGNLRVTGAGSALGTFWRGLTNLTIDPIQPGLAAHSMSWNTSQTTPWRRVDLRGNLELTPARSLGTYIANSRISGAVNSGALWKADPPTPGGASLFAMHDSEIGSWTGRGGMFLFAGVDGAPADNFGDPGDKITQPETAVSRDAPFLYLNRGRLEVFVPDAKSNSRGYDWGTDARDGRSLQINQFYIAKPTDTASELNRELSRGKNLLLTPGVYKLDKPLDVG